MSKDRQQQRNTHVPTAGSRTATMELREQPQVSITKDRDQIAVTAQATATGKDVEAAVAGFERASAKQAEANGEIDHLLGIPQLAAETPADNVFIRQGAFAGPPRKITIDVEVNGTEDLERLSQTILRQIHAMLLMKPEARTRPPANIPKAVHHLRRAVNAVGSLDPLWRTMEEELSRLIGPRAVGRQTDPQRQEMTRQTLGEIAAVLDLDVHAGAAAKDVRAAIEALS